MTMKVADLHCDLLAYLAKDAKRAPTDLECRCAIPQLKAGGVHLQTMAAWTETKKGSVALAKREFDCFTHLQKQGFSPLKKLQMPTIAACSIVASIENASGLVEEDEPLQQAFDRLEGYLEQAGPILYITLTWHDENRFGGGNQTAIGLKKDGETFLDYINGKGIAIDFSHTSDALAYGILNAIDKKGLSIPVLASHSNFRAVTDHPRNLPDDLAKELFKRGAVISLNLIRDFVGWGGKSDFVRHFEHGIALGGASQLCLGADFFYDGDLPIDHPVTQHFFNEYADASCYPHLLTALGQHFSSDLLEKLAWGNFEAYLKRTYANCR